MTDVADLARLYVESLPDDVRYQVGHVKYIATSYVDHIANDLAELIGRVVAIIIDAGSERDAVIESLYDHIRRELLDWTEAGFQ